MLAPLPTGNPQTKQSSAKSRNKSIVPDGEGAGAGLALLFDCKNLSLNLEFLILWWSNARKGLDDLNNLFPGRLMCLVSIRKFCCKLINLASLSDTNRTWSRLETCFLVIDLSQKCFPMIAVYTKQTNLCFPLTSPDNLGILERTWRKIWKFILCGQIASVGNILSLLCSSFKWKDYMDLKDSRTPNLGDLRAHGTLISGGKIFDVCFRKCKF